MRRALIMILLSVLCFSACKIELSINEKPAENAAQIAQFQAEKAKQETMGTLIFACAIPACIALVFAGIFGLMITGDRIKQRRELELRYRINELKQIQQHRGEVITHENTGF